jgi:hypothetical protein
MMTLNIVHIKINNMSKNKKKKIESGTHPQFTNILESFANAMTIGTKPKKDERRTI